MSRLLDFDEFRDCPVSNVDPLRWYYFPVIGRLYRCRINVAMTLIGHGGRVLEVGYGSGTSFLELNRRFDEVHGLDKHDYGGAIKRIFSRKGVHVHLSQGTVASPPYRFGYFDAVLAISVLEHMPPADQPEVMLQINRLLRPGGTFVAGVPGVNSMMSSLFRVLGSDIREHHFSSPQQVLNAAASVFTIERVVRQPPFVGDSLLVYLWFRARKVG